MATEKEIALKVQQALESLDGVKRAEANPFLYTRVMARLQQQKSQWEKIARFIARPVFALAIVILALLINGWVAYQAERKEMAKTNHAVETTAEEANSPAGLANLDK